MTNYRIELLGCDASTIFDIALSEQEKALVDKLCSLSQQHSEYECMPTMTCKEVDLNDIDS